MSSHLTLKSPNPGESWRESGGRGGCQAPGPPPALGLQHSHGDPSCLRGGEQRGPGMRSQPCRERVDVPEEGRASAFGRLCCDPSGFLKLSLRPSEASPCWSPGSSEVTQAKVRWLEWEVRPGGSGFRGAEQDCWLAPAWFSGCCSGS